MARFAKSVCTLSFVILLSLGSYAAADKQEASMTYNDSVEHVFAAEMKAFGAPPTSSDKGKCQVSYRSTGTYKLSWTASCKDLGNGQVSVTLTVESLWFFGVGDEKSRAASIFWSNMNVILKGAATSNGAPTPLPLITQPAPVRSPAAPSAHAPAPAHAHASSHAHAAAPAPAPAPASAPASAPTSAPASAAPLVALPASANAAMVQISSEPSGADILVDGTYTGCTPVQVRLSSGPHSVRIVKKGFEPWEQSIKVDSGAVRNVAAALETASQ